MAFDIVLWTPTNPFDVELTNNVAGPQDYILNLTENVTISENLPKTLLKFLSDETMVLSEDFSYLYDWNPILRTVKGSYLTQSEMDFNFTQLNALKIDIGATNVTSEAPIVPNGSGMYEVTALASDANINAPKNFNKIITDNFNRTVLGSDYTVAQGAGLELINNQATTATVDTAERANYYNVLSMTDQYAKITLIEADAFDNSYGGVLLRWTGTAGSANGYRISVSNDTYYIVKVTAGAGSTIATGSGTFPDGCIVEGRAISTSISLYVDGEFIAAATDSTHSSGYAGIRTARAAGAVPIIDNFECGEITSFYDGQKIILKLKDNGTSRALTWATDWRAVGVTLPLSTVANKLIYICSVYNAQDDKFDILDVVKEL